MTEEKKHFDIDFQNRSADPRSLKQKGRTRSKQALGHALYQYSKESTLHGLKYLTEKELSIYEKIFWLITFLVSVLLCLVIMTNLYLKWKSNPVIVTINESMVSVSQIPFPSITICPQSKCMTSVFNYTYERNKAAKVFFRRAMLASLIGKRSVEDTAAEKFKKFSDIATICEGNDIIVNKLKRISINEKPTNHSLIQHIEEVAPKFKDLFFRCKWRSRKIDCSVLFNKVLTKEGVCYNMNARAASEILRLDKVQNQYSYIDNSFNTTAEPRLGRINGAVPDLDVVLQTNTTDRDLSCNTLNSGYKIYMHNPDDMPATSLNMYHFAVLDNQMTSLAIKCNIMNTTLDLKSNSPEERQCYFEGERNLNYFKKYTAHNCWLECLSMYTIQKCGCVGFFMPHNRSDQICSFPSYGCLIDAKDELADMEASGNISKICNCLPACYTVEYGSEVTLSDFNFKTLWEIENDGTFDDSFHYSRIVAFFQQNGFVSMRRSKLFGWLDFIANCGGLLGLFLGFSVLSVVELMYYISVRFWCSLKQEPQEDKEETVLPSITLANNSTTNDMN